MFHGAAGDGGREGGEPKSVLVEPLARPYFWAIPPIGPVICTNLKHKRRPTDTNQTNAQNRSSQSPRGLGGLGSPDRESAATREVAGGALLFAMGLPVTYSREVAMLEATGSAVGGPWPQNGHLGHFHCCQQVFPNGHPM